MTDEQAIVELTGHRMIYGTKTDINQALTIAIQALREKQQRDKSHFNMFIDKYLKR